MQGYGILGVTRRIQFLRVQQQHSLMPMFLTIYQLLLATAVLLLLAQVQSSSSEEA